MKAVKVVRGSLMPLGRPDVDTDQIMPRQFLSRIERTGFGEFVFFEWRKDPDSILNDPRYSDATILIAGENFGSGSSRESAVWGLQEYGFAAILAPSFSDIFIGNCAQCGLLPAVVHPAIIEELMAAAKVNPGMAVEVDLLDQVLRWADRQAPFDIDVMTRNTLLNGLDDVSLILGFDPEIRRYELLQPAWMPRTIME